MGGDKVPVLKDGVSYSDWKKRVNIWQLGTDTKAEARAVKLVMNMSGKPEEVAIQIAPTKLGAENGVAVLLEELDKLFEEDKTLSIFAAIDNFTSYRRPSSLSIDEYIREFQQRYKALIQARGVNNDKLYEDGILAYLLLHQANLDSEQQRLIRATIADLTYSNMEKALKRTYGEGLTKLKSSSSLNSSSSSNSSDGYSYKPESVKLKSESSTFFEEPCYDQDPRESEEEHMYYEGCEGDHAYYDQESSGTEAEVQENHSVPEMVYMNGAYYQRQKVAAPRFQKFPYKNKPSFSPRTGYNPAHRSQRPSQPYFRQQGYRGEARPRDSGSFQKKRGCYICNRDDHGVRDCKYNGLKNPNAEKMTFFQSDFELEEQVTYLMGETVNKAILDTGAPTTVCGKLWYKMFEESLSEAEKMEVVTGESDKSFKFGDGETITANMTKKIPVTICGNEILLITHIVDNDVPLLLSREAITKMKMVIDFEGNQISMGGKFEDMQLTRSGHVVLPIGKAPKALDITDTQNTFYVDQQDSHKLANHLHRYFAHSSAAKISPFIRSVNLSNCKEVINNLEKLDKSCEFCLKHKSREIPHRKVALPKANTFNDVVAMDLKKLDCGVWIVHFIDVVTRFAIACAVKDKSAEEILSKTFQHWIAILGRPGCFMSDNGGEFVNNDFNQMCSLMNIKIKTSPSESPWCNGTVERHNGILAQMISAVLEDTGCSIDIAISWAVNAKNSLSNVYGFSPYQLVLGKNPAIPNILSYENLPALNESSSSKLVAEHLTGLQSARKKFIELENSARLRRILRERVFESANEKYLSGDVVYFKREKTGWSGPATVVGQLGNQVLLKHGGMLIRIHPCKITLKARADSCVNEDMQMSTDKKTSNRHNAHTTERASESSSSDSDSDHEATQHSISDNIAHPEVVCDTNDVPSKEIGQTNVDNFQEAEQELIQSDSEETSGVQWKQVSSLESKDKVVLKQDDVVRFRTAEESEWNTAVILGRAGKATSQKYQNHYNILQEHSEVPNVIDVNKLEIQKRATETEDILFTEEDNANLVLYSTKAIEEDPKVIEAKKEEIQKLQEFGVYHEVKDTGQNSVSTRWVITKKGEKYKARLVARGFEEFVPNRCDSPTVTKTCLRMVFTLTTSLKWTIESLDITSAFLQADDIEREVFIKPPSDFRTRGLVWQLKKPLYGLGDSSRLWYFTLQRVLKETGCVNSKLDKSLFCYYVNNKLSGLIVTHVDDLLYAGNTRFKNDIIKHIMKTFKISRLNSGVFTYLGWKVNQTEDCITIDQRDYGQGIKAVPVSSTRRKETDSLLIDTEKKQYQGLLGKLLWLSSQTRPDLSYDTLEHSTHGKSPRVKDLLTLNKVVKRISEGPSFIQFQSMDIEKDDLQIVSFSDASLGNLPNKEDSGRGLLVFLTNGVNFNIVSWSSKKIKRKVHSVFGAETLACLDATAEAIFVRQLLSEILYQDPKKQIIPISSLVDSRQLYDQVQSTGICKDQRVRLDIAELREELSKGTIKSIVWIPTELMLADGLTKKGACCRDLCTTLETGIIKDIRDYLCLD